MRHLSIFFSGLLACSAVAQTSENNLGQTVWLDGSTVPPTLNHTWWGTSGMHYLVHVSTDLMTWTFLPDYNPSGANALLGIEIPIESPRIFTRIFQFDPADLSAFADTDTDGLPDIWEQYYFGGFGFSSAGDNEPDGFSNLEEVLAGTRPNQAPDASSAAILNLSVWTPFR